MVRELRESNPRLRDAPATRNAVVFRDGTLSEVIAFSLSSLATLPQPESSWWEPKARSMDAETASARLQVVKPRTGAATSIPGLLSIFHNVSQFPPVSIFCRA